MTREGWINAAILAALIGVPVAAYFHGAPFVITLATRVAILALAGVGLNLALGQGGLVSFGHAAFFGLGGYTAGILAAHAGSGRPIIGLVPAPTPCWRSGRWRWWSRGSPRWRSGRSACAPPASTSS
jgi:branched-chain amino acid transport system permease protein